MYLFILVDEHIHYDGPRSSLAANVKLHLSSEMQKKTITAMRSVIMGKMFARLSIHAVCFTHGAKTLGEGEEL